jgi:hypothetical protein
VGVWDEYEKNIPRSREHFSLQSPNCQVGVACLAKKTKGYTRCIKCLDETVVVWLPNNNKMVYMGHCRFLPEGRPYRTNKKSFDRTIEAPGPLEY